MVRVSFSKKTNGIVFASFARNTFYYGEFLAAFNFSGSRRGEMNLDTNGNFGGASFQRLRIAQVAPLYESVPPRLYGGTERVVSYITEELVRRGHEVTLFASGDSQTKANLVPGCPQALRLNSKPELGCSLQLAMLTEVFESARDNFDAGASPIDYSSFSFAGLAWGSIGSTKHGPLHI